MGHDARSNLLSNESDQQQIMPRDHRGRPLQIGDEILLNTQGPIFYRVIGLAPVLDPKAPPNLVRIEVAAAVHFIAPKGSVNKEFIRVRTVEEAGMPTHLLPREEPPA